MNLLHHTLGALFATTLAVAPLGLFVALQPVKRDLKWTFVLYSLSLCIWSMGQAFAMLCTDHDLSLLIVRLCHVGVVMIPIFLVHFFFCLSGVAEKKKHILITFYIVGFILQIANAAGLVISDVTLRPHRNLGYIFKPGPFYAPFLFFWFCTAVYGFAMMFKAFIHSFGIRRNQLRLLLWGMLPSYIGGAPNFLFGYDIVVQGLMPFGTYLLPVYVAVTAYAIVRHQLLDIEVIVKRTLVFAGLAGSVVAVVSVVAFISQDLLATVIQVPKWVANVLAAAIIAGVYGPLRNWLTNATDKYLFQKKYDYKELLKKFTDEVMIIVDLKQLVQMTVNTLSETVKLESCSLLLLNKDTRKYEGVAARGANGQQLELDEQEQFVTFLRETHEPIGFDEHLAKVKFTDGITDRMKRLKARLCLPLTVHEDLIGILSLGKKKSDEEFTKDDFDILLPLAKTLAIAIANAQLFDELAKTQAEAAQKEKLAVIGTLSAGINHEICNPLGIVKTQCEAFLLDLQDGIMKDKAPQEVIDRAASIMTGALKQVDRATAITQKLSSFAKPIKAATMESVSVAHEVDEVMALVSHDLKLERIDVTKEIPGDLPPIVVDRRQLQEVLFNLIRNAGQAIKPPGAIKVRAYIYEGSQVRIEIADTGSGIPPDKLGKIYDPFFTTKEPGKGTGLGLFIVRQIVERNRGRIAVESVVGKGTTFYLDFPAAKAALVA